MKTGSIGTFVISWSQTEVDGISAAPLDALNVGALWRWSGAAVRIDAPQTALLLEGAEGASDIRNRAARTVRRLLGSALGIPFGSGVGASSDILTPEERYDEQGFVVTDGLRSYCLTIIMAEDSGAKLLMMIGDLPAVDRDLWIVRSSIDRGRQSDRSGHAVQQGGVICFTPDTRLLTPKGLSRIGDLRPGDRIETRDNGPQPVLWIGHRRMSGARLFAMPHLRPVRFRAGALGIDRPDEDLVVSPQHRMLIRGDAAYELFNTPEVLVAAEHLVNDTTIIVESFMREVTYVHVMLEQHNIVWANGLETESFHPASIALETVDPAQRAELYSVMPLLEADPENYGSYVRRSVSAAEAAILRHDLAA